MGTVETDSGSHPAAAAGTDQPSAQQRARRPPLNDLDAECELPP
jgi:hypothetical protein